MWDNYSKEGAHETSYCMRQQPFFEFAKLHTALEAAQSSTP